METTTQITSIQNDEMSLKELILKIREWYRYLLTKWKIILLAGFLGGALGFTYAYFKKPVYTAECTFVLEDGSAGRGIGQYAGLAALAGINMGGSGGGIFQGDNILELYKSRTMLEKTLLSKVLIKGKEQLLIDRYIEFNKLKEIWSKNPKMANFTFSIPRSQYTRLQDSVMTGIIGDINGNYLSVEKKDKKLSIIDVSVKSKDEIFAKEFADQVVATVNNFYIETKTKKVTAHLRILQQQADSVRRELNAAIGGTAAAIDANPNANPALAILRVPSQRRQIDVQASSAIYAEVVKNLEMARVSVQQEMPLIQVVDEPLYPLPKVVKGKIMTAIIAAIGMSLIISMALLFRLIFKGIF